MLQAALVAESLADVVNEVWTTNICMQPSPNMVCVNIEQPRYGCHSQFIILSKTHGCAGSLAEMFQHAAVAMSGLYMTIRLANQALLSMQSPCYLLLHTQQQAVSTIAKCITSTA